MGVEGGSAGEQLGLRQINLESFYENELAKFQAEHATPGKKTWGILEGIAKEQHKHRYKPEVKSWSSRPLSTSEKLRRQALFMQARIERVRNLHSFQQLVDYFESTVNDTQFKEVNVPRGLNEQEKKAVLENWSLKGWKSELSNFDETKKKPQLSLSKSTPFRTSREHARYIKNLISPGNNPVELAEGLKEMGFYFSEWKLKDPVKMNKLAQFFNAPHAREALEIARSISNWDNNWFANEYSYKEQSSKEGQIDFLIQLAQNPDPRSIFPPELVKKIDILSKVLNIKVNVDQIKELQVIALNPDYVDFIALLGTQLHSFYNSIPPFDNIIALDKAGVLKPLVDLYHLGVTVGFSRDSYYTADSSPSFGKLFAAYIKSEDTKKVQQEVIQSLQVSLDKPEVPAFLQNPAKQELVGLITNITGSTIPIEQLLKLEEVIGKDFSKSKELVYILKLVLGNRVGGVAFQDLDLKVIEAAISDTSFMETVTKQDFLIFLQVLQHKTGYCPNLGELYQIGAFKNVSKLADIFNNPEIRQGLLQDSTVDIIKAIHPEGNLRLSEPEYYIKLAGNPGMVTTISLLKDLGFQFDPYRLPNAENLENIANSPNALDKLASPELKNLCDRLGQEFKYKIEHYDIPYLINLFDNKALQEQIFKPENIDFLRKMRPYGINLVELNQLLAFDLPRRELLIKLADDFSYHPGFAPWRGNKQQEMLDKLLKNSDLRDKLFSKQTIDIIKRLKEFVYYNFDPEDVDHIVNLPSDFPDFLRELKQKTQYSFRMKDVDSLMQISANKENFYKILESLVRYSYQFKTEDITNLSYLTPFTDNLASTVMRLNEVFTGYVFDIKDSQGIVFIMQNNLTTDRLAILKQVYDRHKEYLGGQFNIQNIQSAFFLEQIEDIALNIPDVAEKANFVNLYIDLSKKGQITADNKYAFIEIYKDFNETQTTFSFERMLQFRKAEVSPVGRGLEDLIHSKTERMKMLLDYACFTERLETNKVNLVINRLKSSSSSEEMRHIFEYIRWLPENEVSSQDTLEVLEAKYNQSQQRLRAGFRGIFPNSEEFTASYMNLVNMNQRLNQVCQRFKLPTRKVNINSISVNLPGEFIKEFTSLRKQDSKAQFIPELAAYLINEASKRTTAYTMEDLIFSQIGDTEDTTGRRRGRYKAEQLFQVMENNVEASLYTWTTAIGYQKERANSPLFVIANERTGPADLAAEYLPEDFANRFGILRTVDYDKFFDWFRQNEQLIETIYIKFQNGEEVKDAIPTEIISLLGIGEHAIIPIYRLKVPSSLNAAVEEPEGIDTILNFLKLASILGGRTLFMDESTRSAPRSIECLYNVLNRRQQDLGGAKIRLFGKINGVQGQNGTPLEEVSPKASRLEIAFIDPWHSEIKSITDDSVGFVPEIRGKGVVEVISPSYTSVSPYGISTLQDFWKQIIANEVTLRYEGFSESGGAKKRKEEFKPAHDQKDEIFTQDELKEMAFNKSYRALVLDLDGTVGLRGEYNPLILDQIKQIAGSGVDVVISSARSIINNPEYDGSISSFIQQLGELSKEQKSHIHLATENAAIITSLSDIDNPHEAHLISEEIKGKVDLLLRSVSSDIKMFSEQGALILRGFPQGRKTEIMDALRQKVEQEGLAVKVVSDSNRSIHIRVTEATKRNVLNWLEGLGINVDDIAKIGDSPEGNDRPMFWGKGSFSVGKSTEGTLWTIYMNKYGGGPMEVEHLLKELKFSNGRSN